MNSTSYVYIITNKVKTVLYIGVTSNLERRISEHKQKLIPGFSARYNLSKLVYYEDYNDIRDAIAREKQLKGWVRKKKNDLIATTNLEWCDLSTNWYSL